MAILTLKFLGEPEVVRDGQRVALPPSRKTRALLAYLALNPHSFRREQLCELLWEIPDDPRGSLRWSLSKLRRIVDDEGRQRIIAEGPTVRFDATDVAIDIVALKQLTDAGLDRCSIDDLEAAAARYAGNPLEALDLPDFHDFDAWCVAQREDAARAQTALYAALVRRLQDDFERALPPARALVRLAPYDEAVRASLIRLLVSAGRSEEAQQQYKAAMRVLKEIGLAPSGDLLRALRASPTASRVRCDPVQRPELPVTERLPSASPLVGRDVEVDLISAALMRCIDRRRAELLLISGEPGIGKSRLLEAAATLARDRGALVLDACAYESESIRPFALWIDALRQIGPDAVPAVFEPGERRNREWLLGSLSDSIVSLARAQPIVLMFDDLQWGDDSSAAALHYVARMNKDEPLLGILAARQDELRDNTPMLRCLRELRQAALLQEIRLGPLPQSAVCKLISTRLPSADSEKLSRECGGNPLLAIELARAEAAGDSVQSLAEVVRERLARFDAEGGDVLNWAAVLAPRIDTATLARVTGLDWNRIGEVFETAARHAILLPTERGFRFSHDLIARSIYSSISLARRRTMHRRIAELLEQDMALDPQRAADLAHHASQSGDAALAARAMVSAGQLCLRFFANDEALTLARKGLHWAEQLPAAERVCMTLELREVMLSAAPVENWEEAARDYAALAEQALDHGARSHARRGYYMASYLHWMHGHWAGAREEILQSERVTRAGTEEDHIIGMAEAARCLAMLERDLAHADAMLMEAQALAARRRMSHHAIVGALGMLRFHENKMDEAVELLQETRTLARCAGDRISEFQANEYLTMIEIERGRLDRALVHSANLIELGAKIREGSERPFAHALHALCCYASADNDRVPLEAALDQLRSADAKQRLAYTLTRAALQDIERKRCASAIERATEALSCATALDRATEILLAHIALARAYRDLDDAANASKHVGAIERLQNGAGVAVWARDQAAAFMVVSRET